MSEETKCVSCGCACMPVDATEDNVEKSSEHHEEEAQFAVLLALVPAMTMTLFNMMGLL